MLIFNRYIESKTFYPIILGMAKTLFKTIYMSSTLSFNIFRNIKPFLCTAPFNNIFKEQYASSFTENGTYYNVVNNLRMLQSGSNVINRGSYMSAHVLLNILNNLGKRNKMQGLPSI